jgi:flagellar protein FlbT
MMYLSREISKFQENYFKLIGDIIQAAPSTVPYVTRISNYILTGTLYKALKEAGRLVDYERTLISHAQSSSAGLSAELAGDGDATGS